MHLMCDSENSDQCERQNGLSCHAKIIQTGDPIKINPVLTDASKMRI